MTTVIVGNCGISAATATMRGEVPDPMNLLGEQQHFIYPTVGLMPMRWRRRDRR